MNKGTLYHMIARVAFLLSSYAIHIIMAYYLADPRDYGTLGVIISMITIARVFLSAGLPQATSRFIAQDEEHADAIFRKALTIQYICAAIITALYVGGTPLWTYLLHDTSLTGYILLSAVLIPLMGIFQIHLSYLNGKRLFGLQAFFIGLYSVGRFVVAFILVLLGMKILGVLLGFIISTFLVMVLIMFSTKRKFDNFEFESRKLVNFAVPVILFSLCISFLLNLDILLLKHYFPDSPAIGYYAGAMNLGKAPYFIFYAFSVTILPSVAKALSENDIEKARGFVKKNLSYLLLLSIPSATMVLATSDKLLDFVYPGSFTIASTPLGILIFSMSALAVFYFLSSIITARGMPVISMLIVFLCIPTQIGLSMYLIPKYQMNGAAYSNLIAVSLGTIVSGFFVFRYFKTLFDVSRIMKTILASSIIYFILIYVSNYPVQLLPLIYIISFAIFILIMIVIGGIKKEEIAALKRFVYK